MSGADSEFDIKDYPRKGYAKYKRYHADNPEVVVRAEFELSPDEVEEIELGRPEVLWDLDTPEEYDVFFEEGLPSPAMVPLFDLARELGQLRTSEGTPPWVRLHYVYPYPHVDAVIPLMAEGLLTPYLDIPFQHASPKVLRAMKRPANEAKVLERLKGWREICPEIAIRSSFVVGFPGETEDDFKYLLDWLEEAQLDRVGAFRFEPVEGAQANTLPDPVPEAVKEERYARIMEVTERISAAKLQARIGKTIPVIIDEVGEPDEDGDIGATGRSQADAPEIDGAVYLRNVPATLAAGDIVSALVEDADAHDLFAAPA